MSRLPFLNTSYLLNKKLFKIFIQYRFYIIHLDPTHLLVTSHLPLQPPLQIKQNKISKKRKISWTL